MKRFLVAALVTSVGLLTASAAFAAAPLPATLDSANGGTYGAGVDTVADYVVGTAANGIQASRHNVGSLGNYITVAGSVKQVVDPEGNTGASGGASEICVFCHTPHHTVSNTSNTIIALNAASANTTSAYSPAPLWNRRGVATSYTAYGTTIGGTTVNAPGGVTLACLSCHDGVTSIDNLVNAAGEGGMNGATYTDAALAGYTFQDADNAIGGITGYQIGSEARLNIGNGSGINGDLSNDHPMSMPYSDGLNMDGADSVKRGSLRLRSTEISSIDLAAGLIFSTGGIGAELRNNLSQNNWAVKGFISDTATIEDLLRNGKVECSSCHDPHFKNNSNVDMDNTTVGERASTGTWLVGGNGGGAGDGVTFAFNDGLFLRRVGGNAGSGVCRTCHNK